MRIIIIIYSGDYLVFYLITEREEENGMRFLSLWLMAMTMTMHLLVVSKVSATRQKLERWTGANLHF